MKKLFLSALVALSFGGLLRAEATKEFTSDNGLYAGLNGDLPMNIFQWSFSAITVSTVTDTAAPEGATSISANTTLQWGGWGVFNVTAVNGITKVDRNYSDYTGGHLRFWLKSSTVLTVRVEYYTVGGSLQQIPMQIPSTAGVWKEVVIPLSVLAGLNLNRVTSPFMIAQEATPPNSTSWSVDHIRWTKPVQSIYTFPASITVNAGRKRQITVEGRDAAFEPIYLHAKFFTAPSVGVMNPADPFYTQVSTLTASTSGGSVTATVLANVGATPGSETYLSGNSNVTVTANNLDRLWGLISETVNGVELGDTNPNKNSELLLFSENTANAATLPVLTDDGAAAPEGLISMKVAFKAKTLATQYQGLAVQWGRSSVPAESADTHTLDMSDFYEGSLRFWFKGPSNDVNLINNLQVGIRSGNVAAGKEMSKVLLKNYTTFDNQWHSVAIPMSVFARGRPFADLSRTKIFFIMSIAGPVSAASINIDNVRWDTQMPQPLARIDVTPNLSPDPVLIPLGFRRLFQATGYDANNAQVDISPVWDFNGGSSLGTLSTALGPSTVLTAANSPVNGIIRASVGGISGTSAVNVAAVNFSGSLNVYSDLGFGGQVGIATGPSTAIGTDLGLSEILSGGAEGLKFMRSTYTLVNTPGQNDAYALWFVEEPDFPRYMGGFDNGYLHFFVRTARNLEISIRSANVNANTNRGKILLSEYGIPLDGTWQEVVLPLDAFKQKETNLDFTQIKTYFSAAATVASTGGPVSNQTFDIDDVRWLTTDSRAPDVSKVYEGLKNKQRPSGLVRSYDSLVSAYTYDQALAAMAFTYHRDFTKAQSVFDVYKTKFVAAGAGFDGFYDEYDVDTLVNRVADRLVGPNAYLLLSLIHYRNVTGSTGNDAFMAGLANWLKSFQDGDGAVRFGRPFVVANNNVKSTEHNFDCYAAFKAYALATGNAAFLTSANQIYSWLTNSAGPAWNAAQGRFNVGTTSNGITPNTDKALDAYSWAPLALSSYTAVVGLAEAEFGTTKTNALTGLSVTGFDFSGPIGSVVDRDAVWLEGTAQMVLSYLAAGNQTKATFYLNELRKGIVNVSPATQGLAYATNDGTAYGFTMTSIYPSVSSNAWYIFAERGFNPFQVYPVIKTEVRNISNNQLASPNVISWPGALPGQSWSRAAQYIDLGVQPIASGSWGLQIYTHNASGVGIPQFVDPTPGNPNNADSDPAGLLYVPPSGTTSSERLPLSWSIKDTTATATQPLAADPNDISNPDSFQWFFAMDRNSPAIDRNNDGDVTDTDPVANPNPDLRDSAAFADGNPYVTVQSQAGVHGTQDPAAFFPVLSPNALYLQTNFFTAAAQSTYQAPITLEFFFQ